MNLLYYFLIMSPFNIILLFINLSPNIYIHN